MGVQLSRRLFFPSAGHGNLVEAGKQDRSVRGHDRGVGRNRILHDRESFLRRLLVWHPDYCLSGFRTTGRLYHHLDSVAPDRSAAGTGARTCRQRTLSEKRSSSYGRSAGAHLAGWRALIYFRSWKDAEKNLFSSFQAYAIDRSALANSACDPLPMFHGDVLFGAPQDRRSFEQQTKQQIALVL